MQEIIKSRDLLVNCRIGSLESQDGGRAGRALVNCRIGSLEKHTDYEHIDIIVNCRIGSLENADKVLQDK